MPLQDKQMRDYIRILDNVVQNNECQKRGLSHISHTHTKLSELLERKEVEFEIGARSSAIKVFPCFQSLDIQHKMMVRLHLEAEL